MRPDGAPVLLVEDDPDDVLLTELAFEETRFPSPLRVVRDGEEAVAYLGGTGGFADRARFPLPALVLLDLKLPRRSGFEVLAWIRAHPVLRRLPVVVLTSSRETSDVDRAYGLGASSYIVKPVAHEALLECARTLERYWFGLNERPSIDSR
jgi:CheY-like chemotaxis protein